MARFHIAGEHALDEGVRNVLVEQVVDLLARVTTVPVETQRIVEAMKKAQR